MPISVAGSGPGELPPYYKGPDTKVLDFLRYFFGMVVYWAVFRLLEEYRIKCESKGNYREA